ncbi:MAG: ATP synthase F1 subunit epsilon [Bacteroidales bacterium]|nr:ATP synthase F1 subunit epsilon [Bacteroidales bacterium]MCM1147376.1 ATP synthase F1 subunit epsilon [Bacteroidales bacterium]MCM1207189.1 ATP synthase F1 subunit epsilon [Bacillota bacterium]MCM1510422.1 ATP synthase F1 subunit epsilon [Clostridium sp.]
MITLTIVSPENIVYSGAAEKVVVPGTMGQFEILENHAPLISSLDEGDVRYTTVDGECSFAIKGGFVEVKKNAVDICVEV